MSHYADYIAEREGKQIVEDDKGFATYLFTGEYCYIENIFVAAPFRKQNVAKGYADIISEIAKGMGYRKLLGSVRPSANGSTDSLKVLLSYGFKLKSSDVDAIFMEKEL